MLSPMGATGPATFLGALAPWLLDRVFPTNEAHVAPSLLSGTMRQEDDSGDGTFADRAVKIIHATKKASDPSALSSRYKDILRCPQLLARVNARFSDERLKIAYWVAHFGAQQVEVRCDREGR